VIVPPATIGMLGGGQLGRYALVAARVMGYGTIVVDPDPDAPAGRVADTHLVAAYDDGPSLDVLAGTCAVVTTEFENPPAGALERLATTVAVAPSARAVSIAQDRLAEKAFLVDRGFAVAPYTAITTDEDLAVADVAGPSILKSARFGYDGKGQVAVTGPAALAAAWARLGRVPCVLERRVPLDVEVSALVARTADGRTAAYPIAENAHAAGILDVTVVPARIDPALAAEATATAVAIAGALEFVGLLAVELFVSDGRLLVNELAPRPHNSGHWTLDAAPTSQFEQQVRGVCGLALGATALTTPAVAMANLLGDGWRGGEPDWSLVLADPEAHLHLYGKAGAHRGRKMGHLTVTGVDVATVEARARGLRAAAFRTG
jgi:5-(carboxyamino)imidazole ribonucleotide synthase